MDQTIADYKQLNPWSNVTRIPFRTEYSTLISSVHFKFEMCRRHFRSDIFWIIIWLISGHTINISFQWISARYYMRRASLRQAMFWHKGFNMGPRPLYLNSISDTILDISIVFCFCFFSQYVQDSAPPCNGQFSGAQTQKFSGWIPPFFWSPLKSNFDWAY